MIFGNLMNSGEQVTYPAPVNLALDYLRTHDMMSMEPGVYEIKGRDLYVQVIDAQTNLPDQKRPEVHKYYVDLQYSPAGNEKIGFTPDLGAYQSVEGYNEEKDIMFYEEVDHEVFLKMTPGCFAVFFPWDIHRPACAVDEPALIRKIVVKIHKSLFTSGQSTTP